MSDDWESAADEVAVKPVVNQWDGEDAEEEAAPDAWDAEPEEPKKKDAGSEIVVEKKKAITKRALQKKEEEERKMAEKMAAAQLADPNYKAASREELKRLEEERDAALAGDLFGMESIKPRDASSDLPGAGKAAAASAAAAASPAPAAAASSAASSSSVVITPNSLLKAGARLEEAVLDTDADVDKFIAELGRRLEKLGKSALASKKILKLTAGLMDESVKLGLLRLDDVGELKRLVTVKHNDMNAKLKAGGKKKPNAVAAKPAPALARNAFMHGDVDISNHSDQRGDDYDFI